jgi:glycosyltransferase involved in cell wall biosynthesis
VRIAFLTPTLELHGGNLVMLKYAEYLAARGHEVTVFSPESTMECVIPGKVRVSCYRQKSSRLVYYSFQLAYLPDIVRCLRPGFDRVIPIFSPFVVHAIFARWWLGAGFKLVLFFQDFFEMIWVGNYIRFLLGREWIESRIDKVIAVSQGIAADFYRVSGVRSLVIPNGIDDLFFAGQSITKGRNILFVGRPGKEKGFDVFERAMLTVTQKAPGVEGVLVSTAVADGRLGNIRTVQYRNREQLAKLYAEALVYVHAAIGESFGLPPLEAMASGTATVLTKTIGTNDFARDEVNCLATEYGDHEGLARNILRVVQDESLRLSLEANGRLTAAEYRWSKSLDRFEQAVSGEPPGGKVPTESPTRAEGTPAT